MIFESLASKRPQEAALFLRPYLVSVLGLSFKFKIPFLKYRYSQHIYCPVQIGNDQIKSILLQLP